jgi:branched-chain amino acid transport system ATP-binding protein
MMLEVMNVTAYYDTIEALKGVSLHVDAGEVVSIIGANGAGKTTLLKTITGFLGPRTGSVRFQGQELTHLPSHKIVELGIAQVMEGRQLFGPLTVLENLKLGSYSRWRPAAKGDIANDLEMVFQIFPILKERRTQAAATLSGGEQQMVAVGRALMSCPKLLLLDEPSIGLAPLIIDSIFQVLEQLNAKGLTILLVEQNATRALEISNRCYVLEVGKIMLEDKSSALMESDQVIAAYLGVPD